MQNEINALDRKEISIHRVIIGNACDKISNGNPHLSEFRQKNVEIENII